MVAYDVDTSAVMDAVRRTEAEIAGLASVPSELQRSVHTLEAALGASRVARAFTDYGNGELLPRWRSVLHRAEDAVQGINQAVAEYLRADDEMRTRAEAAAAAVSEPSGKRPSHALPPVGSPIVPSARPAPGPKAGAGDPAMARPLPAPFPQPLLPPPQEPEPEPERLVPLPGPPPWNPEWLFRPALPGRPPIIPARDLMLRLRFPCPGHWHPNPGCSPRWWGPAYPPGGWYPRWPEPGRPPGNWFPRWPEPGRPPRNWFPRWPEPCRPPQGRFPWWSARPLSGLVPDPRHIPSGGHELVWPLETPRLPFALAVGGPEAVSRGTSSGKWGLT
jgi:hypothetical protein